MYLTARRPPIAAHHERKQRVCACVRLPCPSPTACLAGSVSLPCPPSSLPSLPVAFLSGVVARKVWLAARPSTVPDLRFYTWRPTSAMHGGLYWRCTRDLRAVLCFYCAPMYCRRTGKLCGLPAARTHASSPSLAVPILHILHILLALQTIEGCRPHRLNSLSSGMYRRMYTCMYTCMRSTFHIMCSVEFSRTHSHKEFSRTATHHARTSHCRCYSFTRA